MRINATNRLRDKYNEYKKLNIFYTMSITGISTITIGMNGGKDIEINKLNVSSIINNVVLA